MKLLATMVQVCRTAEHKVRAGWAHLTETASPSPPAVSPPDDTDPIRAELFGIERLEQHAETLAAAQSVGRVSGGGNRLARRLRDNEAALRRAYTATSVAARDGRSISPAAAWLIDNFHVVQEQVRAIRVDLPPGFQRELPKLTAGPFQGFPRVYGVAWAIVAHTDSGLDSQTLRRFLTAYQKVQTLTIGELWAVPITLRVVLVENLRRLAEGLVREQLARQAADQLADCVLGAPVETSAAALKEVKLPLPMAFAVQFVRRLRAEDPAVAAALRWLDAALTAQDTNADRIVEAEQQRQGATNVSIRNVITSMRLISAMDWRDFVESVSAVDAMLGADSNFALLDFPTRELYRHAIERLARRAAKSETEITRLALSHAKSAASNLPPGAVADKRADPGFYLIGRGRVAFAAALGSRPALLQRLARAGLAAYLGGVAALSVLVLALALAVAGAGVMRPAILAGLALLGLLPASDIAVTLINSIATSRIAATALPGLELKAGVPEALRTLIAVPILLTSPASIDDQVRRLEVLHLGNQDGDLVFALVSDFTDAPTRTQPADAALLAQAVAGVARLNARHGPAPAGDRFLLLHRTRLWNASEGVWMGWERKRGKLHELNRLLRGATNTSFMATAPGDPTRQPVTIPAAVRYVLVLDADTRLPRGAAKRLIGKMAHPLNAPVFDPVSGRIVDGHGVLQPRVTPALPTGAEGSRYQWVFGNTSGLDPYASAVSDIYQDLFGEGSYCGKGIYDLDAFEQALAGRIPENTLLSHDLLEGIFARAGLASDIEVIDGFPARYDVAVSRQVRWARGDWQLLPWILGRARGTATDPPRRHIPAVGRWKMLDNLRRSLSAPAAFLALLAGWCLPLAHPWGWSAFIVLTLATPALIPFLSSIFPRQSGLAKLMHALAVVTDFRVAVAQSGLLLAFLPYQAWVMGLAILRTLYRMRVSHRHLLEWVTADQAQARPRLDLAGSYRSMGGGILLAAAAAALVLGVRPAMLPQLAPFLLLWLIAPALARWVSEPAVEALGGNPSPAQAQALRAIARGTWGYFERFVTAADNFLPPDNYQEDPQPVIAHRTSPTNIGLYFLSVATAADFSWISLIEAIDRLEASFATLHRLTRHRGHFFNWYDTQDLRPLEPEYISSVDSGNLAGHLIAVWNFCRELALRPVMLADWRAGMLDPLTRLQEAVAALERQADAPASLPLHAAMAALATGLAKLSASPADISAHLAELVSLATPIPPLVRGHPHGPANAAAHHNAALAADALLAGILGARHCLATLLPWAGLLAADGVAVTPGLRALTETMPSLHSLPALRAAIQLPPGPLADAFERSTAVARDLTARLAVLENDARAFFDDMKFGFLFHPERELLAIGYRVADGGLEDNFYDLLASEARLASLIGIAKGDLPTRHWFRLGRAMSAVGTGAALVSWSGSMFEYLMPSLVMRAPAGSLMERSNRQVVREQRRYGAAHGVPWGASESAYNARDLEFTYQYSSFGTPSLGLKYGLGDSTVVAPYATALASMVDMPEAVANFRRLAEAGGAGAFGFYEALDYTKSRLPEGDKLAVVRAYMAHHQGMSIVAIATALDGGAMRRRFHAEPMIEASELLLQERMPHDVALAEPTVESVVVAATVGDPLLATQRRFVSPHAFSPRTHLLSNGSYAVMITAAGAGYSRWRGLAINRWREDPTCDGWGSFVFLRDRRSGAVWSAGYQPAGVEPDEFHIVFSEGRAEITRRDGDITTLLEIAISSEDDAEVRRVSVTNHGGEPRDIEITSYSELVLADAGADIAHPAFSKMFVETSFLPEFGALLATRRRRAAAEPEIWAAHIAVLEGRALGEIQFETDRARFIGRDRSLRAPLAMQGYRSLGNSQGFVLDPIFALRRAVRVPAKSTARIGFWTMVANSRPAVLSMLDRHHGAAAFSRATTLAWTQAQLQLRHLGLDADDAAVFQRIANRVIYAEPTLRPSAAIIAAGAGAAPLLWQHGISGDRPIVLVTASRDSDLDLVRRLLLAHEYWGLKQLAVDLVILNEQTNSYAQEFQASLTALVNANRLPLKPAAPSAHGAIFVLRQTLMSPESRGVLFAAARAVFYGRFGSLAEQVAGAKEPKAPVVAMRRVAAVAAPRGMPKPVLEQWNGLGGFAANGREYVTLLENGAATPAPWINVLSNPEFGCLVSASGAGTSWASNSQQNHLTPWSNDPVCDAPGEAIFVRDDMTGEIWGPTASPIRVPGARYVARHGMGFSRFEHVSHGIALELTVFVPVDDPIKISRLKLTNLSGTQRRLSVTAYVAWVLGAAPAPAPLILTELDPATGAIFARNPWGMDFGARIAFADLGGAQISYTGDRRGFIGRNSALDQPAALLTAGGLDNIVGAGLDPCAALQTMLELPPDGTLEVVFCLGQAQDRATAQALIGKYRVAELDAVLGAVSRQWDAILGRVQVKTPDRAMDIMLNGWLLYQALSCRVWARAAFYQASGAYGFRDQLQDSMALCLARPDVARAQLLRAAGRQFLQGDVQHWWLPENGKGIRTRITDDRVWLAYVTEHYVRVTGDLAVLDEVVPYLDGPELQPGESEAFFAPPISGQSASLFAHCVLALNSSLGNGPHGLPLIGTGDWNDGMNRVGQGGTGESIWLGWLLHNTLTNFAKLAEARGDTVSSTAWRAHATELAQALETSGWDGDWFKRAYFDDGSPLGSEHDKECRIDSIAQSWAVISGAGDPVHAATAMASVDKHLVRRADGLVLLFTPPFENPIHDPGYIKAYPPGVRENGGQYTHAAIWSVIAFAMLGDGDKAAELFGLINPINKTNTEAAMRRYAVEPYVAAADVYAEPHTGRGGWSWYTGAAGWFYRAGVEWICGLTIEGDEMVFSPCIPKNWPGFSLTYRHHSATYDIRVENPGGVSRGIAQATLDGVAVPGAKLRFKLADDSKTHLVHVTLGVPGAAS